MHTSIKRWGEKPYHSLNYHYQQRFGQKIYKLAINGGFTCPNRDGTLGTGGCIFCSSKGSGDFAATPVISISEQILQAKALLQPKLAHVPHPKYIAYFQAFTNTYAPVSRLRALYEEALAQPDIVGIAIGTRPDCLSPDVVALLKEFAKHTAVYVELGLQSMHESTARWMHRGYPLSVFETAIQSLCDSPIQIVVHVIAGLPVETTQMFYDTIQYLNTLPVHGIKIAMLHILKGTDLAIAYKKSFSLYSLEEYCDIIATCVGLLRPDIVIHRLTGDGPKQLLIAPTWTANKKNVLNTIHRTLKLRQIYQGIYWEDNAHAN